MNAAERAEKLAELGSIREGTLPPAASIARLLELAGDADEEVRAEAAEAAMATPDGRAASDLVLRLLDLAADDRSAPVRAAALRALGRVLLDGVLLGLEAAPVHEGEPERALVARARAALKAAVGKAGAERLAAIEGLACEADDVLRAAIGELARASDRRERRAGVVAMGRSGDGARFGPAIVAALDAPDREVALAAIDAAADAHVEAATPRLLARLRGGDAQLAARAATALGALGGEVGSALLEAAEGHEDDDVRQAAQDALAELADETHIEVA